MEAKAGRALVEATREPRMKPHMAAVCLVLYRLSQIPELREKLEKDEAPGALLRVIDKGYQGKDFAAKALELYPIIPRRTRAEITPL